MASNKDKLIASAQKLVEKGAHDKAIKEYLKVVALDEKDVRVWLKIGDLYAKIGKKTEAIETYQRVAKFYSDQGFYLKAVAVYKQILRLDPRLIEINQHLAGLYRQLGLLSDAMQQYEAVASFYQKEGKNKDALLALRQLVELDPDAVPMRIKLAEFYSKEGMTREAIDEFTKAADQLKHTGRIEEYMKVAERLLFLSPDNRVISRELAGLYIEKGDPRRALPKLQVCFKADPRDGEVLSLLAQAFEALDQRQKAVSVLKELARILGENGDKRGREQAYRKILTFSPDDPEAREAIERAGGHSRPIAVADAPPPRWQTSWNMSASTGTVGGTDPNLRAAQSLDDHPLADLEPDRAAPELSQPGFEGTSVGEVDAGLRNEGSDEDEISKILGETDVYIKYNLHAKAIDHLQRVFERDPRNIAAREKLKALYVVIGKPNEAVLELWALHEHSGGKRRYLREILEIDPSDARASELLGAGDEGANSGPIETGASEAAAGEENIDVESIEELTEDDFDIAEPSDVIRSPLAVEPDVTEVGDYGEAEGDLGLGLGEPGGLPAAPERFEAAGQVSAAEESEEDVIPVVVDDSPSIVDDVPEEAEVEDRFGLPDDEGAALSVEPEPSLTQAPSLEPRPVGQGESGPSLEDDLDEADFFVQQSLFDEARAILETLATRYPDHPLVATKLQELRELEGSAQPGPGEDQGSRPAAAAPAQAQGPAGAPESFEITRRGVIEKGVTPEDFETHFDLGIAYKEMGLFDDAINEFRLVMKDPSREVQCLHFMGLCYLEKGMQTEAIGSFKKGLYVEGISDRETLSLYFELGQAYGRANDPREALYYYEKVSKRDAGFRDVQKFIDALRSGEEAPSGPPQASSEEVDSALDGLLGGD